MTTANGNNCSLPPTTFHLSILLIRWLRVSIRLQWCHFTCFLFFVSMIVIFAILAVLFQLLIWCVMIIIFVTLVALFEVLL